MTRILYWNIDNFSIKRIKGKYPQSQIRNYIVNKVFGAHVPDIFVIVEVSTTNKFNILEGIPIIKSCAAGVIYLLQCIRKKAGNQWCLIPPLNSGNGSVREGVAVFYNSNRLQFIGPYVWSYFMWQSHKIYQARPSGNTSQDYSSIWKGCLPKTRSTPTGYPNAGVPERRLAGQWEFKTATNPTRIGFPNDIQDNNNMNLKYRRSPFYAQFIDLTVNPRRIIKLFSVHTSPKCARQAVKNLAVIPEIRNAANNEVNVIVGDFNVDSFAAYSGASNAYGPLVNTQNYKIHLSPRTPGGFYTVNRKPYCLTHFLPVGDATPFNPSGSTPDPQHNVYPRFGYMGSTKRGKGSQILLTNAGAIDNVFTRYGSGLTPPTNHNMTIVNSIVSSPYNRLTTYPTGVTAELRGGLTYLSQVKLNLNLPTGLTDTGDRTASQLKTKFNQWYSFKRIRATSDHLPLIIDV